ncbi:hypothetical protein HK104_009947 [Borealophlyctis nickersoniae]|nr:hypothetical protein HK104_009947 [Borealophlyctis nickersoniae]
MKAFSWFYFKFSPLPAYQAIISIEVLKWAITCQVKLGCYFFTFVTKDTMQAQMFHLFGSMSFFSNFFEKALLWTFLSSRWWYQRKWGKSSEVCPVESTSAVDIGSVGKKCTVQTAEEMGGVDEVELEVDRQAIDESRYQEHLRSIAIEFGNHTLALNVTMIMFLLTSVIFYSGGNNSQFYPNYSSLSPERMRFVIIASCW